MSNSNINDFKKSLSEAASFGLFSTKKIKDTINTASEILHEKIDGSAIENATKNIVSSAITSFRNKNTNIISSEVAKDVDVSNIYGINLEDTQEIEEVEKRLSESFNAVKESDDIAFVEQVEKSIQATYERLSSLDRSDERAFTKMSTIVLTSAVKFSNINEAISLKFLNSVMHSIIEISHNFFSKYGAHELTQNLDPIYVESIKKASKFANENVREHLFDILAQSISTTSLKVREGMVKHFEQVAHESFDTSINLMEAPFKMGIFIVKEPMSIGATIGKESMSLAQKALSSIAKGAFSGAKEGIKKVDDIKEAINPDKPMQKFDTKTETDLGDVEIHAKFKEN